MNTLLERPCSVCGKVYASLNDACDACMTEVVRAGGAQTDDLTRPGRPDRSGQTLQENRYLLERRLGQGGMGDVYLASDRFGAFDRRLAAHVAVKLLAAELIHDVRARERMATEAELLFRVQHPNIVNLHAFFEEANEDDDGTDNDLVLVMELVQGGDLETALKQGRPSLETAIVWLQGILSGLAALHAVDVLHRDVKPSNVLLTESGVPRLTDLGIALDHDALRKTSNGVSIGTPMYMSPEAVQALELTFTSDIYSCGVVAYELLAGRTPFNGHSAFEVQRKHVQVQPDMAPVRDAGTPEGIVLAVEKALRKKPGDRWQSAHEFAEALAAVPMPEPMDEPDPSAQDRGPEGLEATSDELPIPKRRHNQWLPAGVLLAALACLVAFAVHRLNSPKQVGNNGLPATADLAPSVRPVPETEVDGAPAKDCCPVPPAPALLGLQFDKGDQWTQGLFDVDVLVAVVGDLTDRRSALAYIGTARKENRFVAFVPAPGPDGRHWALAVLALAQLGPKSGQLGRAKAAGLMLRMEQEIAKARHVMAGTEKGDVDDAEVKAWVLEVLQVDKGNAKNAPEYKAYVERRMNPGLNHDLQRGIGLAHELGLKLPTILVNGRVAGPDPAAVEALALEEEGKAKGLQGDFKFAQLIEQNLKPKYSGQVQALLECLGVKVLKGKR